MVQRLLLSFGVLLALLVWGSAANAKAKDLGEPLTLEVPGSPDAFYYRPAGKGMRPVVMYLHGRGGNPQEDCKKWARVGTAFGWVVCPQGPEDRGGGARAWANGAESGQRIMDATLAALRVKYKGRVRSRNHILIGFSEGAFIAQQVGLKDPQKWSRWLILAASDRYWFGEAQKSLDDARRKLQRVFLLTGEHDGVVENTQKVGEMLRTAHVPTRVRIVPGMGHEVPADRMVSNYRRPLLWLAAAR